MRTLLLPLVLALGTVTGCAAVPVAADADSRAWITPPQAVLLAADAAPRGVRGTFAMHVRATGTQNGRSFLNSELDYRDQRNLTVALSAHAAGQLRDRLGGDPLVVLKGRRIVVTGTAVRTRIHFFADGRMTDKYYYQTHVNVADASQVVIQ